MRRGKQEIISNILDICIEGANKTRIVYQANLNFRTVSPYMDLLIKNGLIDNKERTSIYRTTQKGLMLLENFKTIQKELFDLV